MAMAAANIAKAISCTVDERTLSACRFGPMNKVASLQPVEALVIGADRKSLRLVLRWEVPGLEH
jgi:hypothetical protein